MVKLKKLIQQAKNGKIPWDTEIRLSSRLLVNKSLINVSSKNWKKIRHITPNRSSRLWDDGLMEQIVESGKLVRKSDNKFVSKEILEEFKKYVDND